MFEPKATAPHLDSTIATSVTDGGSINGDRKLKESTPRLAPGRPQPPTMGFDNRAADREAHAHAAGLGRVEGFKETRQALRAQPMAGIAHRDAHALRLDTRGAESAPPLSMSYCLASLAVSKLPESNLPPRGVHAGIAISLA